MRKHINSTDKFIDVNTGTLVLDTTPTKGSFNAVTSDGVATAIEQGGGGGGSYSAGNGVSISEGTISAKVDGSTIGFDASGNLKSLASGGAGGDIYYVQGTDTVSSIVAAIGEGKLPVIMTGRNGKTPYYLTYNYNNTELTFSSIGRVSARSAMTIGFITVTGSVEDAEQSERVVLPPMSTSDYGKVLTVVEGDEGPELEWASLS